MKNIFLVTSVMFLILFASYFELVNAQYIGNLSSQEKALRDLEMQSIVEENFEAIFGYPKCDITNFFDSKSFGGCFNDFSIAGVYFWIVLSIFVALVIGVFFIKLKLKNDSQRS